jgi:hypothetical protein
MNPYNNQYVPLSRSRTMEGMDTITALSMQEDLDPMGIPTIILITILMIGPTSKALGTTTTAKEVMDITTSRIILHRIAVHVWLACAVHAVCSKPVSDELILHSFLHISTSSHLIRNIFVKSSNFRIAKILNCHAYI